MGERTEMYYMPQMSAQPAHCVVESWTAARAVEQLRGADPRPWFGFVSFVGPHPPFAPPVPFNRMYDPDRMPDPITGDLEIDHLDQTIPRMNDIIWAESINRPHARILKARYYGEISYIDACLGTILDAVDARPDADDTLICFFSDHGDHLGDHHAWQKESFFDASARIPFLVSWPVMPRSADSSVALAVARTGGVPGPGGILDLAGDLARLRPTLALVPAAGDPHGARRLALDDQVLGAVGEVLAEQQPHDAGVAVQHRRRVAVGVGAGAHDQPLRLPAPPAVEAAPHHQVDITGIAAHHRGIAVSALANRQNGAAGGGEQRWSGEGAIAPGPVLEQPCPLIHHPAIAQHSTRAPICRALEFPQH